MKILEKAFNIVAKEGIYNYIRRKLNISYLDSKTVYTISYRNRKTKIILNRAFGFVDMKIFEDGIYEKDVVDDIFNVLQEDKVLVDIGANIGQHSLLLSQYCKHVYAFEPIPAVFNQFNESINKNQFKNITSFNMGIGDRKESKSFNYVRNHAGTSSFVKRDANKDTEIITVKTDTLNNILPDIKVDVIKIDVEGYEAIVILGNKDFIIKNKPIVFLEFSPHWILREGTYAPEALYNFFYENNFEVFSRNSNKIISPEELNIKEQDNWIIKPVL